MELLVILFDPLAIKVRRLLLVSVWLFCMPQGSPLMIRIVRVIALASVTL